MEHLYAPYATSHFPDYFHQQASDVFTARLLAAIRSDQHVPEGYVGKLDEDPFCVCQDNDGFHLLAITMRPVSVVQERADVLFAFGRDRTAVRLDLVSEHGRWKVEDIHSREIPSLLSFLAPSQVPARVRLSAPG